MGNTVFPWARNSVVQWVMSKEPHTNAWAVERLADKYAAKVWFCGPRVYVICGGVEVSRVIPTLTLESPATVLSWVESVLNSICNATRV